MSENTTQTSLATMRPKQELSNQKVDMFSAQGFALANRIATAFASSDAVPTQYRAHNLKRVNGQEQWIENPSAIGNCIVAIEVAQAVGMSVSSVMQNSDVIEGKVRWSDKFVVAGINASRRFTPLRFDVQNLGVVKASYKEKGGWDSQAKRYTMTDKTVEIENFRSVAWALPSGIAAPASIHTLKQAKDAGLPVVEGPPVSMKLAVEEGWYGKAGSKWQTELKHKMLMMRSGRYFGDVHAADITMGIGKTTEEEFDVVDVYADGTTSVTTESLRTREVLPAVVVQQEQPAAAPATPTTPAANVNQETGEIIPAEQTAAKSAPTSGSDWQPSTEELAAIQARELAEAGGQQPAAPARARRAAASME